MSRPTPEEIDRLAKEKPKGHVSTGRPKAESTNPRAEQCENCGAPIGRLEVAHVWQDRVICARCERRLKCDAAPSTNQRNLSRLVVWLVVVFIAVAGSLLGWDRLRGPSYRERTEPFHDSLLRLQADLDSSGSDADYHRHLGDAEAAFEKWRSHATQREQFRTSGRAMTLALIDYGRLILYEDIAHHALNTADVDAQFEQRRLIGDEARRYLKQGGECLNSGD